jgi:hypothetical protein
MYDKWWYLKEMRLFSSNMQFNLLVLVVVISLKNVKMCQSDLMLIMGKNSMWEAHWRQIDHSQVYNFSVQEYVNMSLYNNVHC